MWGFVILQTGPRGPWSIAALVADFLQAGLQIFCRRPAARQKRHHSGFVNGLSIKLISKNHRLQETVCNRIAKYSQPISQKICSRSRKKPATQFAIQKTVRNKFATQPTTNLQAKNQPQSQPATRAAKNNYLGPLALWPSTSYNPKSLKALKP